MELPATSPPVVIVQHMPAQFTQSLANRLDSLCALKVIEAQDGVLLKKGCAYLAPGHSHLTVTQKGTQLVGQLSQGEPVNRHRPSVDTLFFSVAAMTRLKAIGVILTGMGKDGALGLKQMKAFGATTIGQDESSSVVYGMPREAKLVGAVDQELPLLEIGKRIAKLVK